MKKLNWWFRQSAIGFECKHEWIIITSGTKNGNNYSMQKCIHCGKLKTVLNDEQNKQSIKKD